MTNLYRGFRCLIPFFTSIWVSNIRYWPIYSHITSSYMYFDTAILNTASSHHIHVWLKAKPFSMTMTHLKIVKLLHN